MSRDQSGFLTRWAKRKAEAREGETKVSSSAPAPVEAPVEPCAAEAETAENFDVSTLPSIETLTAQSDITAFMQRGVPKALRDAAIQQMWVTDPAIRDYIGLSEMSWDFNAPGSLYGFGDLAPEMDIAKFVAQITDGPKPVAVEYDAEAEAVPALPPSESPALVSVRQEAAGLPTPETDDRSEEEVVAVAEPMFLPAKRRHGGATPR